jgi:hypothetical protein
MAELYRILVALMALFMQMLSSAPPFQLPTPVPTATPVPPTATSAPPTSTRTATQTPLPTATATRTRILTEDPLGVLIDGQPPAQNQPSAFLIFPLVESSATTDTILELNNMTNAPVTVKCIFVDADDCRGLNFFINLTALQPLSWSASNGRNSNGTRISPPFLGQGELKCFVQPRSTALSAHNAIQGRAIVNEPDGATIGYNAIGIRRLQPGDFTGSLSLDGITYEQCADRLHFHALASQATSDSELILVPCTEDIERVRPGTTAVQFAVINEFEQHTSGSVSLTCYLRQRFSRIPALRRTTSGTDSIHAIVRAVNFPVMGMVIDRFQTPGGESVSSNTPYLEGGRSASVHIP